jgi:hypothetical protein
MADGEICFNGKDYEGARQFYEDAFKLIPEPKRDYSESTQVISALGDCFFFLRDYGKAKAALDDVLLCPGGAANPFVRLRRGQVFHLIGDNERARTELTTAYLNGGREVFEGEEDYLRLISDVVPSLPKQ